MKWMLLVMLLAGCSESQPTKPEDVETKIVGKYEDCTIYRTHTLSGPDLSWIRCRTEPKIIETKHTESCGKNCTRVVTTSTVEGE